MTDYKGPNAFSRGGFKPAKPPKSVGVYARSPDGVVRQADGPAFNNKFPKSRYPRGGGQSSGDTDDLLLNMTAPVITGTPTVGETLSCSTGTWTGSPTGYAYQWERDGVAIGGATSSTYLLVNDDGGTSVSCLVTASKDATSASQISNALDVSGGSYAASAVHFDSTARLDRQGLSIPNSPYYLASTWTKVPSPGFPTLGSLRTSDDASQKLFSGGFWNTSNDLFANLIGSDGDGSPILFGVTGDNAWSYATWFNTIVYCETNHAIGSKILQIVINGVLQTLTIDDLDASFELPFNGYNFYIPKQSPNSNNICDAADFQIWTGVQTDLSDPANVAKFISGGKPVDPAIAALAFGPQTFLFSGDMTAFPVNQGTGGTFTLTGALTNASTSPSD